MLAGFVNNFPDYTEDFQVSPVPRAPAIGHEHRGSGDHPADESTGLTMTGNLPPGDGSSVHTLQDVPIFASGPGAEVFGRVMDNTEVFFGMADAIGLDPSASAPEG